MVIVLLTNGLFSEVPTVGKFVAQVLKQKGLTEGAGVRAEECIKAMLADTSPLKQLSFFCVEDQTRSTECTGQNINLDCALPSDV